MSNGTTTKIGTMGRIHLIWPRPHLIKMSSAFVFELPVSYFQLVIFIWPTTIDRGFIYKMNQMKWEEMLGELRHPSEAEEHSETC